MGKFGAEHGDESEEDKDGDLAQTAVAVGVLTAGIKPRTGDAQRADEDEPPGTSGQG